MSFRRELTVFLPRDNQPRDLEHVPCVIADGHLRTRDLNSEIHQPHETPAVYAALRTAQPGLNTVVFDSSGT